MTVTVTLPLGHRGIERAVEMASGRQEAKRAHALGSMRTAAVTTLRWREAEMSARELWAVDGVAMGRERAPWSETGSRRERHESGDGNRVGGDRINFVFRRKYLLLTKFNPLIME